MQIEQCLALAEITAGDDSFVAAVRALGVSHPLLDEGLSELTAVIAGCAPVVGDGLAVERA